MRRFPAGCVMLFALAAMPVIAAPASSPAAAVGDGDRADGREAARSGVTIAVTDSGLGGLSVVAGIERGLREAGLPGDISLVFCNALFDADSGYNSLPSREAKVAMFDRALAGMQAECQPDLVVIACNTLSVIYGDTEFAAHPPAPVLDIVACGVDLVASSLTPGGPGSVILFGTETTIAEGAHRDALLTRGFDASRVVSQACPQLAACIEAGFDSEETGFLVEAYVAEAAAAASGLPPPCFASLNCTHYGYALDAWRSAFAAQGLALAGILDPNQSLADKALEWAGSLVKADPGVDPAPGRVKVRVVSMPPIAPSTIASLARRLQDSSPATAAALRGYELRPRLFDAGSIASGPDSR